MDPLGRLTLASLMNEDIYEATCLFFHFWLRILPLLSLEWMCGLFSPLNKYINKNFPCSVESSSGIRALIFFFFFWMSCVSCMDCFLIHITADLIQACQQKRFLNPISVPFISLPIPTHELVFPYQSISQPGGASVHGLWSLACL